MKKISLFVIIILFVYFPFVYAHSGRTDTNGGHYDNSEGEYHYHHGYSAHQHINGLCPYETELSELLPDKCGICGASVNAANGYYCFECAYELIPLSNLNIISLVDGDPDKTRSEYFQEVQDLEDKNNKLEKEIKKYKTQLEDANVSSIKELVDSIEKKDSKINNYKSILIFMGITIFVLIINLYVYKKDSKQ